MQEKHDDSGLSGLPLGKAGLIDLAGTMSDRAGYCVWRGY